MLKRLYLLALLVLPFSASAQFGLPQGFDVKAFQKDEETAFWLMQYDTAMMRTPLSGDVYDEKYPDIPFVFQDKKNNWHGVHGHLDSAGHYHVITHHQLDAKGVAKVVKDKPDTLFFGATARALRNAHNDLRKAMPDNWDKMEPHIRRNADNSLTVWFLPQYSRGSGAAQYGTEFTCYYSPNGSQLMATKKYIRPLQTAAFDQNKELLLDYSLEKMPTLGALYFAHCFQAEFKTIGIRYKKGTSIITYNREEKTYAWQHNAN